MTIRFIVRFHCWMYYHHDVHISIYLVHKKDAAINEERAVRSDLENETKKRDELKSEVVVLEKKAEESKRIAIMFASKPEDAYFEMQKSIWTLWLTMRD